MTRMQFQLTEEQTAALKEIARRENVPTTALIGMAIDPWLEAPSAVPLTESRRGASAAVGRFRSGKNDISERHDDYLAEAYELARLP